MFISSPTISIRLSAIVTAVALFSGSVTGATTAKPARAVAAVLEAPVVAVLPFDAADYKTLKPADRMVR